MAVLSMSILVYWSVTEMFYGCSWDDWIVAEDTNWLVGWFWWSAPEGEAIRRLHAEERGTGANQQAEKDGRQQPQHTMGARACSA